VSLCISGKVYSTYNPRCYRARPTSRRLTTFVLEGHSSLLTSLERPRSVVKSINVDPMLGMHNLFLILVSNRQGAREALNIASMAKFIVISTESRVCIIRVCPCRERSECIPYCCLFYSLGCTKAWSRVQSLGVLFWKWNKGRNMFV
jgi:hypothetical protein